MIYYYREGRHRRLAKAGSPATARGCGELCRALLAAAFASVIAVAAVVAVVSVVPSAVASVVPSAVAAPRSEF